MVASLVEDLKQLVYTYIMKTTSTAKLKKLCLKKSAPKLMSREMWLKSKFPPMKKISTTTAW